MRLWDVNVSLLIEAQNNEEALERGASFLRRDGHNDDLDMNFMTHCADGTGFGSLAELRKEAAEGGR